MLTHLPSFGRGGGDSSSSDSDNARTRGDTNSITAMASSSSAAPLMSRRMRSAVPSPAFPAGGEDAAASVSSGSTLISVSPRSAPHTAYCISLVSTTQAANDLGLRPPPTSPRWCCEQLLVRGLPCPPGPTRHGYTGSVTQLSSVQPRRPPPGVAAATGPQPLHGTDGTDGAIGPAHAMIPPTTAPTNARPADDAVAATATRIGGSGPLLPSAASVRMLLNTVAPDVVIGGDAVCIEPLSATHHRPQRIYEIRASAPGEHGCGMHDMLVLILAPPSMLRLLRSEQWIVKSEAVVVKWIRGVLLSGASSQGGQQRSRAEADLGSCTDLCGSCGAKRQCCQVRTQGELFLEDVDLLRLLPALIDHSQSSKELGSAYSILSHLNGLSLSCFPRGLTLLERRHIDFQAGKFIRRLSLLQSPSGKFGPAISVLCPTDVAQTRAGGSIEKPGDMDRWSLAFHAILEGILRDAEDMAVTLAYQAIRRHFRRLRSYLDAVTVPRLVILDAAHDSNIMAERKVSRHIERDKHRSGPTGLTTETDEDGRYPADIEVTGLRDWSNCTFGDPLMAMVFSEDPSREFLWGFSGRRQRSKDDPDDDNYADIETHELLTVCGDIVEQPEEAQVRMLLYQCYHATVAVVKEYYRPRSDSAERELAARKRLHAVLAQLEGIGDDPKRQHFRPGGEMSPAKKPKTEGGADVDEGDEEGSSKQHRKSG